MQILGLYGSPRRAGNTDLMMDAFLEGAASSGGTAERVYVRDLNVEGCLGCGHCDARGVCIQKDDMQSLYPLLETVPRLVVASPIYFYGVTGQLKLLIDRSQASFMKQKLTEKDGAASSADAGGPKRSGFLLAAGATRGKRLFECATLTMYYFFEALDVAYGGDLLFREVDEKGAIRDVPKALQDCFEAGRDFMRD